MNKKYDVQVGDKFGKYTVIAIGDYINGRQNYVVQCECGSPAKQIDKYRLLYGKAKSCGCDRKKKVVEKKPKRIKYGKNAACKICGRESHYAKGMCRACYSRLTRPGRLSYPYNLYDKLGIMVEDFTEDIEEKLNTIISRGLIKQIYVDCLLLHYKNHLTLSDIGKKYGVTRECVRQKVNKCIDFLREDWCMEFLLGLSPQRSYINQLKHDIELLERRKRMINEEIMSLCNKHAVSIMPTEDMMNLPIPIIDGVSNRTYNCLKNIGIDTVYDLYRKSDTDFRKYKGVGKATMADIYKLLHNCCVVSA